MPRCALFDLAVDRALRYASSTGLNLRQAEAATLYRGLELWYLKTRFAYRIPLADIVTVLQQYPGADYVWQGGSSGQWLNSDS